jgi:inositol 3-alpha-galactosyltransferase
MAADDTKTEKRCYVTLITTPQYLPGAIILAHSLNKHNSAYPLIIQYTPSLGNDCIAACELEASRTNGRIIPQQVDLLLPRKGQENTGSVAERFKDTFTKLRAFELYRLGYTTVCFLDADMAIFNEAPDAVFDTILPGSDWIGANHACVCNLDNDAWAPEEWWKGNCAYSALASPDDVAPKIIEESRPTYHLLNSGMFLFHPGEKLWNDMLTFFNTTDSLKTYQFPDQDFLKDFFHMRWKPMSWKYNALKTMRYWHPAMWSDQEVVVVHYIVDKPWERQVSEQGVAGHLGRDGVTHGLWWTLYDEWKEEVARLAEGEETVLSTMQKLINTKNCFTEKVPLPQEVGRPEDCRRDTV